MNIGVSDVTAIIMAFDSQHDLSSKVEAKFAVSSLFRTLFSGNIVLFRNDSRPVFKVDRKQLEEIHVPVGVADQTDNERAEIERAFLDQVSKYISIQESTWYFFISSKSVALRNIDHLIPLAVNQGAKYIFLDSTQSRDGIFQGPQVWAAEGKHLIQILEIWGEVIESRLNLEATGSFIDDLVARLNQAQIRSKKFEAGEIYAPLISSIDWPSVCEAAMVTTASWPKLESRKLINSLYYGTFLDDDSGTILNLIEA